MKSLLFAQDQRRSTIKRFLEAHGKQTTESLKSKKKFCTKVRELLGNTHLVVLAGLSKIIPNFPFIECDNSMHEWLLTIDGVSHDGVHYEVVDGDKEYYISNKVMKKRKNLLPAFEESKPKAKRRMLGSQTTLDDVMNIEITPKTHFKEDLNRSMPNIFDVEMVGDDQFLNLAVFDLKYARDPLKQRRQCGNCVSGLRIHEATKRIYQMKRKDDEAHKRIVVNIGSVDVAEGRLLIEMMSDMDHFLQVCVDMNVIPILTTLAPLPNYYNQFKMQVLIDFNSYIQHHLSKICPVIDLEKCMMMRNGTINLKLYQPEQRFLSGSRKPFVMWNKIGRRQVLKMLKLNLGHALVYQKNVCDYIF